MNVSLSWLFDHLDADWRRIDITELVNRFNRTTAEIESFHTFELPLHDLAVVHIKNKSQQAVTAVCPEWKRDLTLQLREDAVVDAWYVVRRNGGDVAWASLRDFGARKDGLMPAVYISQVTSDGSWKKHVDEKDYILELSNTSLTHRPDLWGIRGLARECGALLGFSLKPLSELMYEQSVVADQTRHQIEGGFLIENRAPAACSRFAAWYLPCITNHACQLSIASRLCRIDQRPYNWLVDATNYVMFDMGQPIHAFDAAMLAPGSFGPVMSKKGQSLTLLDGTKLELTTQDMIISDGKQPLALAGIMGGAASGVTLQTKRTIIEAACFDPATIRFSAARHKLRTEASARFEKNLDPNQNVEALQRLAALMKRDAVTDDFAQPIISLGAPFKPATITVAHDFIERKLGVTIPPAFVKTTLEQLMFNVVQKNAEYTISVPSYRGPRSVTIPEDIVEEVGRFWGYDNITPALPRWLMTPIDQKRVLRLRKIKQHCAYGLRMAEVNNYPFYDEPFLHELCYVPLHAVKAKNPLSQHMVHLVTSLVPHLFKDVQRNIHRADECAFFECARTWRMHDGKEVETSSLAAVWWDAKKKFDFYAGKAALSSLFNMLKLPVEWRKSDVAASNFAWYSRYQTAELFVGDKRMGYAGMADTAFAERIGAGSAFICEVDADFLLAYQEPLPTFEPLAKYPCVFYDISMLVPLSCTVEQLVNVMKGVDSRVYDVQLLDLFEKDEWKDLRSVTLRFYMRDTQKTLSKDVADEVHLRMINAVKQLGAQIR